MGDRLRGLFRKFVVTRTDRTDGPGKKHDGCRYFVLDLDHDPHAVPAIRAYAKSCEAQYPQLSSDLIAVADGNELVAAKIESGGSR